MANAALVVVLPTPPLPDVTTIILAKSASKNAVLHYVVEIQKDLSMESFWNEITKQYLDVFVFVRAGQKLNSFDQQFLFRQIDLGRGIRMGRLQLFAHPVLTGDRHQFRLVFQTEDAGLAVTSHPGQGAAP